MILKYSYLLSRASSILLNISSQTIKLVEDDLIHWSILDNCFQNSFMHNIEMTADESTILTQMLYHLNQVAQISL
jgi:hypothetical protein